MVSQERPLPLQRPHRSWRWGRRMSMCLCFRSQQQRVLQQTWWNGTWSNFTNTFKCTLTPPHTWHWMDSTLYGFSPAWHFLQCCLKYTCGNAIWLGLSLKIRSLNVKSILPWRFPRCTTRTHFPIEYCTYCSDKIHISAPETKQE